MVPAMLPAVNVQLAWLIVLSPIVAELELILFVTPEWERIVQSALTAFVPLLKSAVPELARIQLATALPIAMTEALVLPILVTMPALAPLLVPILLSLLVRILMAVVLRDVPTRQTLTALLALL